MDKSAAILVEAFFAARFARWRRWECFRRVRLQKVLHALPNKGPKSDSDAGAPSSQHFSKRVNVAAHENGSSGVGAMISGILVSGRMHGILSIF